METGYGIIEGDMIKEDKSEGIVISDSESINFGEKSFIVTFQSDLPKKYEHYVISRSSKGISFYLNGHKIPWWARGALYRWWYKRLEKKLSKEDAQGSKEKGK